MICNVCFKPLPILYVTICGHALCPECAENPEQKKKLPHTCKCEEGGKS